MLQRLARMPFKWKVLLGAQAVTTVALIARRVDPNIFNPLFEKKVLVVSKIELQQDGESKPDHSNSKSSFQVAGFDIQVKKPDKL